MIIEKIVIKSFGRLTDMTLEFTGSVNVIEGQNEVGKSTIAAFIKYMLYGFTSSRNASLSENDKKKYMPWDEEWVKNPPVPGSGQGAGKTDTICYFDLELQDCCCGASAFLLPPSEVRCWLRCYPPAHRRS